MKAPESPHETAQRIAWMEKHFKLGDKAPFAEMRAISQRVQAESIANRLAMVASQGVPSFKYVDDLTARIQARRDKVAR